MEAPNDSFSVYLDHIPMAWKQCIGEETVFQLGLEIALFPPITDALL